MFRFCLSGDVRTLAIRYGWVTGLRIAWVAINQPWLVVPWLVLPVPYYWTLSPWGLVDFLLVLLQLAIGFGLARHAIRKYRPDIAATYRIFDDGWLFKRLGVGRSSSWLGTALLMTLIVVFTCVFAVWVLQLGNGPYPLGFAPFLVSGGGAALLVGLGLAAMGLFAGTTYAQGAKAKIGGLFGVSYLAPDHWLSQRVARLAEELGLDAKPAVGTVNVTNAFAMGSRADSAVVIGTPLLKQLTPAELDAVIGHELGHILSGDVQRMQFAEGFQRMLGGVVGVVANIGVTILARNAKKRSTVMLGESLAHLGRSTVFVGSEMMVKGISRSREFHADAVGASVTSVDAMVGALERIHGLPAKPTRLENQYGYLMLRGSRLGALFSTHPTLERRISALRRGSHTGGYGSGPAKPSE